MDVCVATCSSEDIAFLDILLRSLEMFADFTSCDLLVSHNSPRQHLHEMLERVCRSHHAKSLSIDLFETNETQGSQQHGEALNRLIAKTTSKHVLVIDPDIIITSPRWLGFCKRHIDDGCFVVGTPYDAPNMMWQSDFPNVWCSVIDGDILRAAKLDMRPWNANANEPDGWTWSRDTSWRMAEYGLRNRLRYVPLSVTNGIFLESIRKLHQHEHAASCLARLHAFEFVLPGTNEVCCMHLRSSDWRHKVTPRRRRRWWNICANAVLNVCGTASGVRANHQNRG